MRNSEVVGHGVPERTCGCCVDCNDEIEHGAPMSRRRKLAPGVGFAFDVGVEGDTESFAHLNERRAANCRDRRDHEGCSRIAKVPGRCKGRL
jgi:hypothetical protein